MFGKDARELNLINSGNYNFEENPIILCTFLKDIL